MTNLATNTKIIRLQGGELQRLNNLCRVFNIDSAVANDNQLGALGVLTHLYAIPVVKDRSKRHKYSNQILQASYLHFPPRQEQFTSRFHGSVMRHVAMMQEFPHHYVDLNRSPQQLAEKYETLFSLAALLRILGIGTGTSAIVGGITEGIKTNQSRAGVEMALKRAVGQSALLEAIKGRLPHRFARFAGAFGVVLIASGTIAYLNAIEEMESIREIIFHRYQSGEVSQDIYSRVFSEIDPALIKRYWEM